MALNQPRTSPNLSSDMWARLEQIALIALIIIYWYFVRFFEGVDASDSPLLTLYWKFFTDTFPLLNLFTPLVESVLELLSPRVLRYFIPVGVAFWLARRNTIGLIKALFSFPTEEMATKYLERLQRAQKRSSSIAAITRTTQPLSPPKKPSIINQLLTPVIFSSTFIFFLIFAALVQAQVQGSINLQEIFSLRAMLVWFTLWLFTLIFMYVFFRRLQRPAPRQTQIRRTQFEEDRETNPFLRVGGPLLITVGESDVIVTENNGRIQRVLGPGRHYLDSFEHIRAVLDLRQQERNEDAVSMMSKDGIEVRADVGVIFRLDPGDEAATKKNPFPFNPEAVRQAAYAETVFAGSFVSDWEGDALNKAKSELKKLISERRLDELIYPEIMNPNSANVDPHQILRDRMEVEARAKARATGVDLIAVKMGRLNTPHPVVEQRIKYWQAYWQKQARISAADGEAKAVQAMEFARAEGEAAMIQAIVEGINQAQRVSGRSVPPQHILALRIVESLERMARQSGQPQGQQQRNLLTEITELRRELDTYLPALNEEPPDDVSFDDDNIIDLSDRGSPGR